VLAIEPMINEGTAELEILDDGWTAVTADRKAVGAFRAFRYRDKPAAGPEILSELAPLSKGDAIEVSGTVLEALPNAVFRVTAG